MFKFFNSGNSEKKSNTKKVDSRSLRFEALEEKTVLSVSPLSADASDIIPWPLPEWRLEEIREASENTAKKSEAIANAQKPDYEKAKQLEEEGKAAITVEEVLETGEVIEVSYITKEYVEAMGGGVPYLTTTDDDSADVPINETQDLAASVVDFDAWKEASENTAKKSEAIANAQKPDYEKAEQLEEEGKIAKWVAITTETGEITEVPSLSMEYLETIDWGVPFEAVTDDMIADKTIEEWERLIAERSEHFASAQKPDFEKMAQLVQEGKAAKWVAMTTDSGEVEMVPSLSLEYIEASGGSMPYELDVNNMIADKTIEEWEKLIAERSEHFASAQKPDFEKMAQLVQEGKAAKWVAMTTDSGEVEMVPSLSLEYIEASGGSMPYMTTVDAPSNHVVTVSSGQYSGVSYITAGDWRGTGTLLSTGSDVLTSAHLFFDQNGNRTGYTNNTVVYFDLPSGERRPFTVSEILIHPDYTSDPYSDLAIVRLASAAPATVTRYDIYRGNFPINYVNFTKVGYGQNGYGHNTTRSIDHSKRFGQNTYDAISEGEKWLVYDFDNGTPARDALGNAIGRIHGGLGNNEMMAAPGDSGGPGFITINENQVIAGVTQGGEYD